MNVAFERSMERKKECVYVCVCERKREREREINLCCDMQVVNIIIYYTYYY